MAKAPGGGRRAGVAADQADGRGIKLALRSAESPEISGEGCRRSGAGEGVLCGPWRKQQRCCSSQGKPSAFNSILGLAWVDLCKPGVIRGHPVLMPGMGLGGSMRRMPVPGMKGKHGRHHDLGPGRDRQEQKRRNGFPQHPCTSRLAEREQAGCDPSHWGE